MFCCHLKLSSTHLGHFPKRFEVFDTWNPYPSHSLWGAVVVTWLILPVFLLLETSSGPVILSPSPFQLFWPHFGLHRPARLLHSWSLHGRHPLWLQLLTSLPHHSFILPALGSHWVLQVLPLQVDQSSFDFTFFPGQHRPYCVSIWCVLCVRTYAVSIVFQIICFYWYKMYMQ